MNGRNSDGIKVISLLGSFLLSVSLMILPGFAIQSAYASQQSQVNPDVLISEATNKLLEKIQDTEKGSKELSFYYQIVDETVSPLVDFELLAKRVMGRYFKDASVEDKTLFKKAFKESLLTTYAKGIAGYKDQKVVFLPFKGISERKGVTRAKVEMEIRAPGSAPLPVLYSMFLDSENQWKLENIVLNGVNLGKTFRNQFSYAYQQNAGNISQVIAEWNSNPDTVKKAVK